MPAKIELDLLIRDALESCSNRSHRMGKPQYFSFYHARLTCEDCGMEVDCKTRPAPNEIDISGPAVALNCKGGA